MKHPLPGLALGFAIAWAAAADAATPALSATALHDRDAAADTLIETSGDRITVTATGRESYFGRDEGTFAAMATDALHWRFTARVAAGPDGDAGNAKYGLAVRTGDQPWNRGLHVRYDGYEKNRAIQWMFRYGVAHDTHSGARRVMHSGLMPAMNARAGFWLRIERQYPTFAASWSADGETWADIPPDYQFNLPMPDVRVGLMVTAGGDGKTPVSVTYDRVTFEVLDGRPDAETIAPERFVADPPRTVPWEMTVAEVRGPQLRSGAASFFVIKPPDLPWRDVRALFYTTSSKEVVVQQPDGSLTKLAFEEGEGKLRTPIGLAAAPGRPGVYTLTPDPLYRVFAHGGLVRLGTAAPPEDIEEGLKALAAKTGYDGLVNLPWVCQGMSFAGGATARAARLHPGRTIAASPTHIGMAGWPADDPAVLRTPHLYVIGTRDGDHLKHALAAAEPMRQRGALCAVAPLWWYYHRIGHTVSVSLPWMLDVIDARLPAGADASVGPIALNDLREEDGWLADAGSIESSFPRVVRWADATEAQRRGAWWWLPTERSARVWQAATSDWPKTVIHFPRFDDTDGWSGPPAAGHAHDQLPAGQPFTLLASGPIGADVEVAYFADLQPLTVVRRHRDSPYIVEVEGLPPGLHNLYAITTVAGQREISRPQMIYFYEAPAR